MEYRCRKCQRILKNEAGRIVHENNCNGVGTDRDRRKIPSPVLTCPKCHHLIKGKGNQKSHLARCDGSGPYSSIIRRPGGRYWAKGKTYEEIYGKNDAKTLKKILHTKRLGKKLSTKTKKLISQNLKGKTGGYRVGGGRGKGCWYDSPIAGKVYLDSSWELAYVKWLDEKGVLWKRNRIKFPYYFEGKQRHYIPDFYLLGDNKYIEIKGYKTDKDEAKWSSFPYKLDVLMESELKSIGII